MEGNIRTDGISPSFVPVETVLKVSENEIIIENDEKIEPLPTMTSRCVSIGTQCDWKFEHSSNDELLSDEQQHETSFIMSPEIEISSEKSSSDEHMVLNNWPMHSETGFLSDQKILLPSVFSQQFACSLPSRDDDEKILLQLDYKTRNKYKTKQRRLDPDYRSQERVRQRAVMRLKRQDPGFRAAEREKGRCRMRLKRLDPEFRSQERERQRERMKVKRSNPEFRVKEREQQKTRLHVKRLDPAFKEKERAQDRIRMQMKRESSLYTNLHSNSRNYPGNENFSITSDKIMQNTHAMLSFDGKMSLKTREAMLETFHFKKQHILNFSFYNTDKDQWSHELCSKALIQTNDLSKTNIFQNIILPEGNELERKNLEISRKVEGKINSSSETFTNASLENH